MFLAAYPHPIKGCGFAAQFYKESCKGGRLMKCKLDLPTLVEIGDKMPGGFFVYRADGKEELIYSNDIVLDIFGCKTIEEFVG